MAENKFTHLDSQSYCQLIGVSNHILRTVFRFHYPFLGGDGIRRIQIAASQDDLKTLIGTVENRENKGQQGKSYELYKQWANIELQLG